MACAETLKTSAFLDGELVGEPAAQAEAHIAGCAQCQAFVAVAAAASERLRSQAARYPAPPLLRQRIRRRLAAEAAPRAGFAWGALSGVAASAAAAAVAVVLMQPPAPDALARAVAEAHVKALGAGSPIQVASSSHHTVKPWFAGRAPVAPPVGEFAAQGFPLLGGRLDRVAGRKAAVVVYGHGLHEIDLFVWAARGGVLPAPSDRLGYHAVFWRRGDLDFAAVSDVDATEMARFVALARAQAD